MKDQLGNISWDNSNIYKSFQDPRITEDIKFVESQILEIKNQSVLFSDSPYNSENFRMDQLESSLPLAQKIFHASLKTTIKIYTLSFFASSAASVDSKNTEAKNLASQALKLSAELNKAKKPLDLFLVRAPAAYISLFLKDEEVNEAAFLLQYERQHKDHLLSVSEETLLEGHSVDGFHAWSKLYYDIAGSLEVNWEGKSQGIASVSNILYQNDRTKREAAYKAINSAWEEHEISVAAILNSLNGWRLENYRSRSAVKELHFLDKSCQNQRIQRSTLESLMHTTYESRFIGQKALLAMAQEMGVEKLAPWDLLASYPSEASQRVSFQEAMEIIYFAFSRFDPSMADFARMMYEKRWIDSAPTQNRQSGAYCGGFANVREPRVFITFDGSMKNIITLAHELGHAYHNWVMRDLKLSQTFYTASLAETASIFAENLVREALLQKAQTVAERKMILWQEIESAATLLINIPARFEFEKRFLEARKSRALTVSEIKKLNYEAWYRWYESSISEYNSMFWASKQHFSMSKLSFYNYPYLFGYLFSLGIFAKKEEYGADFKNLYIGILRDTGIMTAEDLVKKHLNEDITQSKFWLKSLGIVEKSVNEFCDLQKDSDQIVMSHETPNGLSFL